MAGNFPNVIIHMSSNHSYEHDLRIDRAVDGTGRGRSFFPSGKLIIEAKMPLLTQAEKDSLVAFFNANVADSFGFPVGCPPAYQSMIFAGTFTFTPLGGAKYSGAVRVMQFP